MPARDVYLGGELSGQIRLGMITKTLARTILGLLKAFYNTRLFRYTFGGHRRNSSRTLPSNGDDAPAIEEMPQIVFGLWRGVDYLVNTPDGETPPALNDGALIRELSIPQATRKQGNGQHMLNTEDTFTFCYYTTHVDLPQWRIVNVTGLPELELSRFWMNRSPRIVIFDLEDDIDEDVAAASCSGALLPLVNKRYFFNLELEHLDYTSTDE